MTNRLASSSGPARERRTRTAEPTTALEAVTVDGGRLSIELRHADRLERLTVRDFTPDWITVEVSGGWAFERERMAAKLEVVGAGGFVEQFRCELEFSGWLALSGRLDGEQVGVVRLLLFCERHERPALVRFYRQVRFPALFDRSELPADALVELFERSGYFTLRPGAARPSPAWCEADFSTDLSVDAVYCADDGELLGHVSVTRAYSRTWLGHQLTTINDHAESDPCRAALYNHFATAPILVDGHEQQYLLQYYDRGKPWHQLFFDSFIDWYAEPDKAAIVHFDRYQILDSHTPTVANEDPSLELDQARPAELDRVVALICEQLPPLACAAFDINAVLLDRAYLHPDFATHGIARGRRVFVVREAGEVVGVALCETGSEDLNLFNLFNLTQLYFRPRASSAAQQALITFVRCHYRALGHAQPLIVAPPDSLSDPEEAGVELVETMGCIIWSGQTLRAYRTFLRRAFDRICKSPGKDAAPAQAMPKTAYPKIQALYQPRVAEARARLQTDDRLAALRDGSLDAIELLGFLLQFSALGVRMVEGVGDWRRRAGLACTAAGREALGAALVLTADDEAERDRLVLDNLFELGERWRAELGARINVELLIDQPPPRSVLRYAELREELVTGPTPWAQLGLELELEGMFAAFGPALLEACARTFSGDLRLDLVDDHRSREAAARLARLEQLLTAEPELVGPIAAAGCAGLSVYLDFLGDCVELGRELARRVRGPANHGPELAQESAQPSPIRFAFA